MKTSLVAAVLAALLALGGCASAVMSGAGRNDNSSAPANQADARLAAAVTRVLVRAPEIQAMDLSVQARHGVVILEGSVTRAQLARRAVNLTRRVSGVQQVVNHIIVGP